MPQKKNTFENSVSRLNKTHDQFRNEIEKRISIGKLILQKEVNNNEELEILYKDYSKWNDYNMELLKQSFTIPLNAYLLAYEDKPIAILRTIGGTPERQRTLVERASSHKRALSAKLDNLEKLLAKINLIPTIPNVEFVEKKDTFVNQKKPCVFIGHGRSKLWANVKLFIEEDLKLETVLFESESRVGESIVPILEEMLNKATFAVLILTAEDETAEGQKRARQNVIHEAGLFQGKLGFRRAIILKQSGTEEFSNISGLQYIPFDGDSIDATFYKLSKAIQKELNLTK